MQKDTYRTWRKTSHSLVIQGIHCEIAVPFTELATICDAIAKDLVQDDQRIVPGAKPALPPLKMGKAQE